MSRKKSTRFKVLLNVIALVASIILTSAGLAAFITGKTNLPELMNYLASYVTSSSNIEPVIILEKQKPNSEEQRVLLNWDEGGSTEDELVYLAKQLNFSEDQIDFLARKVYVRVNIHPSTVKEITLTLLYSESNKRVVDKQLFKTDSMLFLSHGVYEMFVQAEGFEDYKRLLNIKKSTTGESLVTINLISKS